jgi:hypothetical protein
VSAPPSAHLERLDAAGGPRGEFTVVIPRRRPPRVHAGGDDDPGE